MEHIKDHLLAFEARIVDKYFDYTRCIFLITIFLEILANDFTDFSIYVVILEFNYFTNHIVSKLIMDEFSYIFDNLVYEPTLLDHAPVFKTNLHNATSLFVSGYFERILHYGFIDWLFVFIFSENMQTCLDDVVPRNINCKI